MKLDFFNFQSKIYYNISYVFKKYLPKFDDY